MKKNNIFLALTCRGRDSDLADGFTD